MGKIDTKHKRFAHAYVRLKFNGQKAYQHVYGNKVKDESARVSASRLLQDDNIKKIIDALLESEHLSTAEALHILSDHAKGDVGQYVDEYGNIDLEQMKADGMTHLIKEVEIVETSGEKSSTTRRKIKFHDPQNAINMILRVQGKFNDKLELGQKIIKVTIGKIEQDIQDD